MRYRVHDFAQLAGVTVKALQHYDRLGLLKPARSGSGHRLYVERDLERLEQIVALKFLGVSLRDIRRVLDRGEVPLAEALARQRHVLEGQRARLDHAIAAISGVQQRISDGERFPTGPASHGSRSIVRSRRRWPRVRPASVAGSWLGAGTPSSAARPVTMPRPRPAWSTPGAAATNGRATCGGGWQAAT